MGEYDWYSRSKLIGSLKLEDWFRNSDQNRVVPDKESDRTKTEPTSDLDCSLSGANPVRYWTKTGQRPDRN